MALFAGFAQRLLNLNEPLKSHPMTHADTLQGQYSYNRKQVLFLARITEEEYQNFHIDTAKAWVERFWNGIYDDNELLNSSTFWKWWNYSWNHADENIVIPALYAVNPVARHTTYRAMHQYVFNLASPDMRFLMEDFKSLKDEFDRECKIKHQTLNPKL